MFRRGRVISISSTTRCSRAWNCEGPSRHAQFGSRALAFAVCARPPDSRHSERAKLVPSGAVQIGQNGPHVFVVKPDSTLELRLVKPASGKMILW